MTSSVTTETPQGKIPLWIFVIFFTVLLVALTSFGLSKYQQLESHLNQVQQTELKMLRQSILQQNDVIDINWFRTLNPMIKEVQGSLLWSNQKQQGIIELFNLPKLKKNQQYHLWIYDLTEENTAPISALTFTLPEKHLLKSFKANKTVSSPFKFELILEEEGIEGGLSLLLAQP